ncbi:hypothetical protein VNO78_24114 [Psophocarpus tetragonolobus]|uniref:Uncharacterized protein n=1 Tax=Psophocarpus tetragonolobus TaxID=3891 RepID=A0AAN9XEF1_PSOTE
MRKRNKIHGLHFHDGSCSDAERLKIAAIHFFKELFCAKEVTTPRAPCLSPLSHEALGNPVLTKEFWQALLGQMVFNPSSTKCIGRRWAKGSRIMYLMPF